MKENILEIKKFIPQEFCKKIISYYKEGFVVASTTGGTNRNVRNCELQDLLYPKTFGKTLVSNYIQSKIIEASDYYADKINNRLQLKKISQCDILKYEANSYKVGYDYHVDMGSKAEQRQLSLSICLNNDFTGGEFEFDLGNEKVFFPQNIGDLIAFPSNFLFPHKVNKITKGTRYAIVSWVV